MAVAESLIGELDSAYRQLSTFASTSSNRAVLNFEEALNLRTRYTVLKDKVASILRHADPAAGEGGPLPDVLGAVIELQNATAGMVRLLQRIDCDAAWARLSETSVAQKRADTQIPMVGLFCLNLALALVLLIVGLRRTKKVKVN